MPRSRDALEKRRAQIEQWIAEEASPIREVELIQQRLDVDAQLAQIDQAALLPELEEAFVKVAASWAKRTGVSAAALREVGVPASMPPRLASEPVSSLDAHPERGGAGTRSRWRR